MKKHTVEAPRASAVAASDTVVVVAGLEPERYTLHKRLITHHSGYFRRVLIDGVKEHRVWYIRGTIVKNFDVFVDWMYENVLPSYNNTLDTFDILSVYVLAERLSVEGLKYALMDRLFHLLSGSFLPALSVLWIFRVLPKTDPLIQLAVDTFCISNGVEDMGVDDVAAIDTLPREYLARVLRKMHHLSKLPEAERKLKREDYNMVECAPSEDKDQE